MESTIGNWEGILPIILTSIGWAVAVALAVWNNRKTDNRKAVDIQEARFGRIEDTMERAADIQEARFERIEDKFERIEDKMEKSENIQEARFERIEDKFGRIEDKMEKSENIQEARFERIEDKFGRIEDKMEEGFAEIRGNFAEMRGEFKAAVHGIDKRLVVVEDRAGVIFPRPETPDPDEAGK